MGRPKWNDECDMLYDVELWTRMLTVVITVLITVIIILTKAGIKGQYDTIRVSTILTFPRRGLLPSVL